MMYTPPWSRLYRKDAVSWTTPGIGSGDTAAGRVLFRALEGITSIFAQISPLSDPSTAGFAQGAYHLQAKDGAGVFQDLLVAPVYAFFTATGDYKLQPYSITMPFPWRPLLRMQVQKTTESQVEPIEMKAYLDLVAAPGTTPETKWVGSHHLFGI